MRKLKSLFRVVMVTAVLTGCAKEQGYERCEGMVWNTLYHVTYKGPAGLQDSIMPVLNKVGASLSVFDPNSLVSRLNASDSVVADESLIAVYDASERINRQSNGRFDPTVSPLVDAWGFGKGHRPSADTLAIDSIRKFIGIGLTRREGTIIIKDDRRTAFNFSAIAKGFGCDAVGEMLTRNGVKDFMVEIGGEITLKGKSPSGGDWKIGVDTPDEDNNSGESSSVILELTDVGMATSGNYRNYRVENGRKTAHTISPLTGMPYFSDILSATVIAATCMEADGLATACMAGTPDEALQLLKETNAEGLLILSDTIIMTPGMKKYRAFGAI